MTSDPSSPSSQRDPSSRSGSPAQPSPADPSAPGAAGSDADADRLAASSPVTPAAELARIAASRPDLHPALAANPATYPDLVDWLRTSPDPAVQDALARRATAQPEPAQAAQAEAPARAANAPTNQPPAGAPAPAAKTKRRTGLPRPAVIAVVVLVTVLVLSGTVVLGTHLLRKNSGSASGTAPGTASPSIVLPSSWPGPASPSASWTGGAHKVWNINVDAQAQIMGNGNQLIVADVDSNHNIDTVTAYDVSGDNPKEQWSTDPHSSNTTYLAYWGSYVVSGDKLIKTDSGETTEAPWHDQYPNLIGAYAFSCDHKDKCTGWSTDDPGRPLWETTVPHSHDFQNNLRTDRSTYQGDNMVITQITKDTLVDVVTGNLYKFDAGPSDNLFALSDGWFKHKDGRFTILSPTGEERESFDGEYSERIKVGATLDHPLMSAAELKALIQDKNVSWAQVKLTIGTLSADCPTKITINDSVFWPVNESSYCEEPDGIVLYVLSSDNSVLMRASADPTSTSTGMRLSGAWTVGDGKFISFPDNKFTDSQFYLVNSELIVARDKNGQLTAYKPGDR